MNRRRNNQLKAVALLLLKKKILLEQAKNATEKRTVQRSVAVRPCFRKRKTEGFYHTALKEMMVSDECHFKVFLRMSPQKFNDLVRMVGPKIFKLNELHHGAISVEERLCLALRFIASGDSVASISFLFRVGRSTASTIIKECMEAIWDVLSPDVFQFDESRFPAISASFEKKWFMPNCIGAIDGKHIQIQAPPNSGSTFFNYKKTFSIVLLAVADASCRFLYCDIGAYGKQSDGGVLRASSLWTLITKGFKDPPPKQYGSRVLALPYFLVGDAAFPRGRHMIRPYPEKANFTPPKQIFNLRLSHARQCVERSFGILVQRFRIFRKPIQLKLENVERVVKAAVCLHNWLHSDDDVLDGIEDTTNCLQGLAETESCTSELGGQDVAAELTDFFLNEGAQSFQWRNL